MTGVQTWLFRSRGQREERTAGVADSWEYNGRGQREEYEEWKRIVRGQREEHEERTARRTTGGEDSHRVDTKKGSIYI